MSSKENRVKVEQTWSKAVPWRNCWVVFVTPRELEGGYVTGINSRADRLEVMKPGYQKLTQLFVTSRVVTSGQTARSYIVSILFVHQSGSVDPCLIRD